MKNRTVLSVTSTTVKHRKCISAVVCTVYLWRVSERTRTIETRLRRTVNHSASNSAFMPLLTYLLTYLLIFVKLISATNTQQLVNRIFLSFVCLSFCLSSCLMIPLSEGLPIWTYPLSRTLSICKRTSALKAHPSWSQKNHQNFKPGKSRRLISELSIKLQLTKSPSAIFTWIHSKIRIKSNQKLEGPMPVVTITIRMRFDRHSTPRANRLQLDRATTIRQPTLRPHDAMEIRLLMLCYDYY